MVGPKMLIFWTGMNGELSMFPTELRDEISYDFFPFLSFDFSERFCKDKINKLCWSKVA